MEWCILLVVVLIYCDLDSKLKKLINNQNVDNKKDFSLLKDMIGKKIMIETDDGNTYMFGVKSEGILKEYNDTWLALEIEDKRGNSIIYYRIKNITKISEV